MRASVEEEPQDCNRAAGLEKMSINGGNAIMQR